ncbi:hypothetical protein HDE_04431 [Halotydeus destructor]|nr:hypothetical protein HDE_04431 [Halotydeus destructor]
MCLLVSQASAFYTRRDSDFNGLMPFQRLLIDWILEWSGYNPGPVFHTKNRVDNIMRRNSFSGFFKRYRFKH